MRIFLSHVHSFVPGNVARTVQYGHDFLCCEYKVKLWGQYLLMRGYIGSKNVNLAEPHIYAWP